MTETTHAESSEKKGLNFVEEIVVEDLKAGKNDGRLQTRFPPEPNGYLHIGHAKAICMDFGIAEKYGGVCNLRLDDTNPIKEDTEYVEAIKEDIQWLGFKWGEIYHASDYFQQLWDFAVRLIKEGKAYIDEQSSEQIAEQKGTPTQPGTPSPYRDRPIEENLELFNKMNSGEAEEGCEPSWTWPTRICTSATPSFIASSTKNTIARPASGKPTRCMTSRTGKAITLKE